VENHAFLSLEIGPITVNNTINCVLSRAPLLESKIGYNIRRRDSQGSLAPTIGKKRPNIFHPRQKWRPNERQGTWHLDLTHAIARCRYRNALENIPISHRLDCYSFIPRNLVSIRDAGLHRLDVVSETQAAGIFGSHILTWRWNFSWVVITWLARCVRF
jgi:hypothetical protein